MNLTQHIIESVENKYETRTNLWVDSPFEKITLLSNDERGKWGEETIFNCIQNLTNFKVEWTGDSNTNQKDGVYDIIIRHNDKKIRIEVKTATRGNTKTANWQHENIYASNKWDKLILFDINFFSFYITIIDYNEMTFNSRHHIFNRKPTLRNNQDDKYKFDFGNIQQKNGIISGLTFHYDLTNPDKTKFSEFLMAKLV
jgi:hypothetical protein